MKSSMYSISTGLIIVVAIALSTHGQAVALYTSSFEESMLEIPPAHPWDVQTFKLRVERGNMRSLLDLKSMKKDTHILPEPTLLKLDTAILSSSTQENRTRSSAASSSAASSNSSSNRPEQQAGSQGTSKTTAAGKKDRPCTFLLNKEACREFLAQEPLPVKPVPRGNKSCPGGCGFGNCNYDLGICMCPAGWKGPTCSETQSRPCNHRRRGREHPVGISMSHIDPVTKHDLNWTEPGWQASRCAGYCDDTIAMCYCGYDSKYAHVPAAPGSPPGSPPIRLGRSMAEPCKPGSDKLGNVVAHGQKQLSWDAFYGPNGWCNVETDRPSTTCPCGGEGITGVLCDLPKEAFCPRQCSGHGTCQSGYCKCHDGWYGTDCSRKAQGLPEEPPSYSPWVLPVVKQQGGPTKIKEYSRVDGDLVLVADTTHADSEEAMHRESSTSRRRPLIYVYDVPPQYNAHMLQYKINDMACSWRAFNGPGNHSWFSGEKQGYGIETFLHEALLNSMYRTFDPEEADFFYVPVYFTCFMWPVLGWADYPYYYAPMVEPRPMHVVNMLLEVKRWLQKQMPWWDRRGGRDHIWLMPHDEGACYMPTEIYNTSIVLTHWGRLDLDHQSGTGWDQDNYTASVIWPGYQDTDWRELHKGHACFTPGKDLVIPLFKAPSHFTWSPLMGGVPIERDILLYFRGDTGIYRSALYSRGIRQEYFRRAHEESWRTKYNIYIGSGPEYPGDYSLHLARSKFCLALPGDGYSARYVDAILHGCIPVVVMDNVTEVFETLLDWRQYAIRIKQSDIENTPQILMSMNPALVLQMQKRLARVWHRFAWTNSPYHRSVMPGHYRESRERNARMFKDAPEWPEDHPFRPRQRYPVHEDAFATLMSWLHSKIKDTR